MKNARHHALACIWISMLTACGQGSVTTPHPAAARTQSNSAQSNNDSNDADAYPTRREIRLGEEIIDPDANESVTSEEDTDTSIDTEPTDAIVLSDIQGEVTFRTTDTSSLRATAAQTAFVEAVARHNREARQQASLEQSEPEAADATASSASSVAAAANELRPSSKPATQAVPVDEKKILADPLGQWASSAVASSTYAQTTGEKAGYSAWQATGAPNVTRYSDSPAAWTTKSGDSPAPEWLELGFAKPVHATSIRIRQSAAPGAISKIELIDTEDAAHEIWSGTDDTPYEKNAIGWLAKDFAKTPFLVKGARITLLTARVWGWNEIDAVQLVGEP